MALEHFVQIVGVGVVVAGIGWAVLEHRAAPPARIPLVGPLDLRPLTVLAGALGVAALPTYGMLTVLQLTPESSPAHLLLAIALASVGSLAVFALVWPRLGPRFARGWLTFVDDRTLSVEIEEAAGQAIRPDSVRVRPTFVPWFLRVTVRHGEGTLNLVVWGTASSLDSLTSFGPVRMEGLMLWGATSRLLQWARPYMDEGD